MKNKILLEWITEYKKFIELLNKISKYLLEINYRFFIYCVLIYIIYAAHHFFPEIWNLYTFKNFTILFVFQIILVIVFEKAYFKKLLWSYFEIISWYFSVSNFFLSIILFFWIFIFYIYNQDLSEFNWFLFILIIWYIYNSIYKSEKPELFKKDDLDKKQYIFIFVVNLLLYFFLDKFLQNNNINFYNIYLKIWTLALFNSSALYLNSFVFDFNYKKESYSLHRKSIKRLRLYKNIGFGVIAILIISLGVNFSAWILKKNLSQQFNNTKFNNTEWNQWNQTNKINQINQNKETEILTWETNSGLIIVKSDNSWNLSNSWIAILTWSINTWSLAQIKQIKIIKIKDIYNFPRYIWLGDTWKDVIKLEEILKSQWYYKWEISQVYSQLLWDSLARFINVKTWAKSNYSQLWPKSMAIFKNIIINK